MFDAWCEPRILSRSEKMIKVVIIGCRFVGGGLEGLAGGE